MAYIDLDLLIFNGTAKTKLVMLVFLYYGVFLKGRITFISSSQEGQILHI